MRVFKSRAEAEKEAIAVRTLAAIARAPAPLTRAIQSQACETLADYAAALPVMSLAAEALEAVEFAGTHLGNAACPYCFTSSGEAHSPNCKLSLALAAFRGEP